LNGRTTAFWFDPTNGSTIAFANAAASGQGKRKFKPPVKNSAGQGDFVLVLEAVR
jgi:hypothetical protein